MQMRLLGNIEDNGFRQMAIDEAIAIARAKGIVENTLRFYTWKPTCVTIGYFQKIKEEVDVERCNELGIDIVRRYTGGGAVYHDKELTYSIIIDEKEVSADIVKSFSQICEGIVNGLKIIGIRSEFQPVNDIIVNGKKISGNAQTRMNGVVLQHGTILLDVDHEKMFSLLKVKDEKVKRKMLRQAKERVTSIKAQKVNVSSDDLRDAMAKGFAKALGVEFVPGELCKEEKETMERLYKEKYGNYSWNYIR